MKEFSGLNNEGNKRDNKRDNNESPKTGRPGAADEFRRLFRRNSEADLHKVTPQVGGDKTIDALDLEKAPYDKNIDDFLANRDSGLVNAYKTNEITLQDLEYKISTIHKTIQDSENERNNLMQEIRKTAEELTPLANQSLLKDATLILWREKSKENTLRVSQLKSDIANCEASLKSLNENLGTNVASQEFKSKDIEASNSQLEALNTKYEAAAKNMDIVKKIQQDIINKNVEQDIKNIEQKLENLKEGHQILTDSHGVINTESSSLQEKATILSKIKDYINNHDTDTTEPEKVSKLSDLIKQVEKVDKLKSQIEEEIASKNKLHSELLKVKVGYIDRYKIDEQKIESLEIVKASVIQDDSDLRKNKVNQEIYKDAYIKFMEKHKDCSNLWMIKLYESQEKISKLSTESAKQEAQEAEGEKLYPYAFTALNHCNKTLQAREVYMDLREAELNYKQKKTNDQCNIALQDESKNLEIFLKSLGQKSQDWKEDIKRLNKQNAQKNDELGAAFKALGISLEYANIGAYLGKNKERRMKSAEEQLNKIDQDRKNLTNTVKDNNEHLNKLIEGASNIQKQINETMKNLTKKEQEQEPLKNKAKKYESKMDIIIAEKEILDKEIQKIDASVKTKDLKQRKLDEWIQNSQKLKENFIDEKYKIQIQHVQDHRKEEIFLLQTYGTMLKRKNDAQNVKIDKMSDNINKRQNDMHDIQKQNADQQKVIEQLQKTNADQQEVIKQLQKTNTDQQKVIEQPQQTNADQQKVIEQLQKTNADQLQKLIDVVGMADK